MSGISAKATYFETDEYGGTKRKEKCKVGIDYEIVNIGLPTHIKRNSYDKCVEISVKALKKLLKSG